MASDRYGRAAFSNHGTEGLKSCGTNFGEAHFMRGSILIFLTVLGYSFLRNSSHAQVANPCPVAPATKLESFDTNIASVVIKATTEIGSLSVNAGLVSVRCREITDA